MLMPEEDRGRVRPLAPARDAGHPGPTESPAGPAPDGPAGPGSMARRTVWRTTGFGPLWAASTVSLLGDRITMLAVPFAAVALHASALQVSVLTTASFLPWLLLGVFAGVIVDRSAQYRKVMICADLGRAALLGSVPLAAARGLLTYWQLLAVALLAGTLTVFFQASASALLPELVGLDQLPDANAKLSASSSMMMAAGPGLAGLLIQAFTAPFAIISDALSYLASASLLRRVRYQQRLKPEARRPFWPELGAGLRFVLREPTMRAFLGQAAIGNLGSSMNGAVIVLFAVRDLHLTAGELGLAMALLGVGGGMASLTANRIARRAGVGPLITAACAGAGLGSLLIGLAVGSTWLVLAMLGVAYFLWGYSLTTYNVLAGSLRQIATPEQMRAQVMSSLHVAVSGVVPVGAFLGGLLAMWAGLRTPILVAGALMLASVMWIAHSPVIHVRTMPHRSAGSLLIASPGITAVTPRSRSARSIS